MRARTRELGQRLRDESGSTLLLTIFCSALALAMILLVVSATSLYIERKRLYTIADGASLVGAEAFSLTDASTTSRGYRPVLRSAAVATAVRGYLRDAPDRGLSGLRLERAGTLDGRSATVRLSAEWRPPVLSVFVPSALRLRVTSTARSVFG